MGRGRWLTGLALLGMGLLGGLLGGCDQRRIARLEEGVSTEAQVRAAFGEPEAVYDEPGGGHTLEYPRQPGGQTNYMITIGPDGLMSGLRQVLAPATFAQVQPGMTREQLRRLLGKPAREWAFALKHEIVWDWRWRDGSQDRVFSATFDADSGRLLHAESGPDPQELYRG